LVAEGDAEIRCYAFGKIDLDDDLPCTVGPGRVDADLRQRSFVGDEWVVGQDRRREEPLAGKSVSESRINLCDPQRGRERKMCAAPAVKSATHSVFPNPKRASDRKAANPVGRNDLLIRRRER